MTDTSKLIERLRAALHTGSLITSTRGWQDHVVLMREAAAAIDDLEARLRIAEKRADDAEARNDFLIKELDKLIEKAKQS